MKLRIAMISVLALISLASADVLWDQSSFDPWGAGFFNSESGEPPFGITMHAVNDVAVEGGGWVINSITTYYSGLDFAWGYGIFEGYLHVYPISDVFPVEDPTADALVPMTGTWADDHWIVKAEGLNLNLTPGNYWIGITPIAPGGMWGPEIHLSTDTLVGADTASYDPFGMPPAWFSFNPGVDASILIEGEWSVATDNASWSSIKALY